MKTTTVLLVIVMLFSGCTNKKYNELLDEMSSTKEELNEVKLEHSELKKELDVERNKELDDYFLSNTWEVLEGLRNEVSQLLDLEYYFFEDDDYKFLIKFITNSLFRLYMIEDNNCYRSFNGSYSYSGDILKLNFNTSNVKVELRVWLQNENYILGKYNKGKNGDNISAFICEKYNMEFNTDLSKKMFFSDPYIFSTEYELIEILGEPESIKTDSYNFDSNTTTIEKTYIFQDAKIISWNNQYGFNFVYSDISSTMPLLQNNISIGMSRESVIKYFGNNFNAKEVENSGLDDSIFYEIHDEYTGFGFEFTDNKVSRISIHNNMP